MRRRIFNTHLFSAMLILTATFSAMAAEDDIAGAQHHEPGSANVPQYRPPELKPLSFYFGAAWYQTHLRVDEPAFDKLNREGRGILMGATFNRRFFLGLAMGGFNFETTESTSAGNYPPGEANYGFFAFEAGYKFLELDKYRWTPWLAMSMAYHDIGLSEWQYSLAGGCTTLTAGMDVRLLRWLDLRASANRCNMKLEETLFGGNDSRMKVTNYGAMILVRYHFR